MGRAETGIKTVLATTFPVHQIVRNVTQGREGLKVDLLVPSQLGCPHDYFLTPRDMRKLTDADVLVVNGLGMEEFLGAPVRKVNPGIMVIDSSLGIEETLMYSGDHGYGHDRHGEDAHGAEAAPGHDHDGEHRHGGVNPHLFASPRMNAALAMNIAAGLSKADPEGAGVYFRNAQAYAGALTRLADEMSALGRRLKNNRIVQPHGVFDYLARDMGLEIVAVLQSHGEDPSAAEMIDLVRTIREKQAGAIFTEPQYPSGVGRTLSVETGVPLAMLDPAATGPDDAPLDYYETVMRRNMKTLETVLGTRQ
jgi:zinc/manganese transport system substrate-binding protein/zinc transport system substrate-binding protein